MRHFCAMRPIDRALMAQSVLQIDPNSINLDSPTKPLRVMVKSPSEKRIRSTDSMDSRWISMRFDAISGECATSVLFHVNHATDMRHDRGIEMKSSDQSNSVMG
jgi:hypothetical protein